MQTEQMLISINGEWNVVNTLVTTTAAETIAMIRVAQCLYHLPSTTTTIATTTTTTQMI